MKITSEVALEAIFNLTALEWHIKVLAEKSALRLIPHRN